MGQAVVDLPDPMDSALPASASGTDDLLSQLAGDEIDRLLAEADDDRAPEPPVIRPPLAPPPSVSVPAATTASPSPAAGAGLTAITPQRSPNASKAPATRVEATPPEDELDALLNQLDQGGTAAKPSESSVIVAAAVTGAAAPPVKPKTLTEQVPEVLAQFADAPAAATPEVSAPVPTAASPEATEAVMSAAEREALGLSNLAAATDAAEQQDAAAAAAASVVVLKSDEVAASPAKSSRFKPAIRVLEWINVPLSFAPDATRDSLGKIGIVTLVNSIAVLIYVLFIR